MDPTTGSRIIRHKIRAAPLTSLVKNRVEALAAAQGMTNVKFTNEKVETLPHADWTTGVDCDMLSGDEDPIDEQNDENDIEEDEEPAAPVVQAINPTHGELNEEEEEAEEEEMVNPADECTQETLDEMIEELQEIVPAGEEVLRQVETVEEDQDEHDHTEDSVERIIGPHREKTAPDRLTHSNFSTTDETGCDKTSLFGFFGDLS